MILVNLISKKNNISSTILHILPQESQVKEQLLHTRQPQLQNFYQCVKIAPIKYPKDKKFSKQLIQYNINSNQQIQIKQKLKRHIESTQQNEQSMQNWPSKTMVEIIFLPNACQLASLAQNQKGERLILLLKKQGEINIDNVRPIAVPQQSLRILQKVIIEELNMIIERQSQKAKQFRIFLHGFIRGNRCWNLNAKVISKRHNSINPYLIIYQKELYKQMFGDFNYYAIVFALKLNPDQLGQLLYENVDNYTKSYLNLNKILMNDLKLEVLHSIQKDTQRIHEYISKIYSNNIRKLGQSITL